MAVIDPNNGNQAQQQAQQAPAASASQQFQQSAPKMQQQQQFSFHTNAGIFGTPIGRAPGTEVLVSLQEKLGEIYKNAKDSAFEFNLIPLDKNNETQLYYSALTLLSFVKGDRKQAAYHTLILEASNDAPTSLHQNVMNDMVEVIRVSSDAGDEELDKAVFTKLRAAYPGVELFNADAMVVPRDFPLEDKSAIHRLALNAALATAKELEKRVPGYSDLNMAAFARDSSLVVTPRFESGIVKNIDELPRRQDVKIIFGSQQNRQQSNNH